MLMPLVAWNTSVVWLDMQGFLFASVFLYAAHFCICRVFLLHLFSYMQRALPARARNGSCLILPVPKAKAITGPGLGWGGCPSQGRPNNQPAYSIQVAGNQAGTCPGSLQHSQPPATGQPSELKRRQPGQRLCALCTSAKRAKVNKICFKCTAFREYRVKVFYCKPCSENTE